MKKVVWTNQALQRLNEIEDYISQDSVERAIKFVDKLVTRSEQLGKHPELGRVVPEFGDLRIREILEGNYRIVYRVLNRVEILTVFEGHMLFPKKDIIKKK